MDHDYEDDCPCILIALCVSLSTASFMTAILSPSELGYTQTIAHYSALRRTRFGSEAHHTIEVSDGARQCHAFPQCSCHGLGFSEHLPFSGVEAESLQSLLLIPWHLLFPVSDDHRRLLRADSICSKVLARRANHALIHSCSSVNGDHQVSRHATDHSRPLLSLSFGHVYLCGAFWEAPTTGTDSKGGTLIHEVCSLVSDYFSVAETRLELSFH